MALPADLSHGMEKLTTDGRSGDADDGIDEPILLGPYTIEGVKRNLSERTGFDVFPDFEPADREGYSFWIGGGGSGRLAGKCAPPAPKKIEDVDGSVTYKYRSALGCVCELAGKNVSHVFVEDLAGEYGGPLVVGEVEAQATAIYKLDSGDKLKDRPAGFRVDDQDGAVAAVDVLDGEARFWIKRDLADRDRRPLICTLVGLMLWIPGPGPKQ